MDIVSRCNLRAGFCVWPLARSGWMLTVICKATFQLEQGESVLAAEQEEIHREDGYWDGGGSLKWPADEVPVKHCADVWVTGSAHAPRGQAVRSLVARLSVGSVSKSLEVLCERTWTRDDRVEEGPPVPAVPLRYEWAAGGPGTSNPVGMTGSPDPAGRIRLPRLQPVGAQVSRRSWYQPVGFGPLAPHWPDRAERLRHHRQSGFNERWREQPLPDDFDISFFNAAPPDQRLATLPDCPQILLDHLHPHHPRLVTRLPDARPLAIAELGGRPPEEVELTADTLAIDSDRGRCTMVWRGLTLVSHPAEQGQVVLSQRRPGGDEDGPIMRTQQLPRHPLGSGSSDPWAVTGSAVAEDDDAVPDSDRQTLVEVELTPQVQVAAPMQLSPAVDFTQPLAAPPASGAAGGSDPWAAAPPFDADDDEESEYVTDVRISAIDHQRPDQTLPLNAGQQLAARLQPVLPFVSGAPRAERAREPLKPVRKGDTAIVDFVTLKASASLPFGRAAGAPPAAGRAAAEAAPDRAAAGDAALEASGGFVMPLERYAAVKALIWRGAKVGEALTRHDIDEELWHEMEQQIARALSEDSSELAGLIRRVLKRWREGHA